MYCLQTNIRKHINWLQTSDTSSLTRQIANITTVYHNIQHSKRVIIKHQVCIVTDRSSEEDNKIHYVCPSVSILTFEPTDPWPWFFAFFRDHSLPVTENQQLG